MIQQGTFCDRISGEDLPLAFFSQVLQAIALAFLAVYLASFENISRLSKVANFNHQDSLSADINLKFNVYLLSPVGE